MNNVTKIYYLTEHAADVELLERALKTKNIICGVKGIKNRKDFLSALEERDFSLVFINDSLPSLFNGPTALKIVREKRPEIPVIVVFETIDEDMAAEYLKNGASEYIQKNRFNRLVPVISRVLKESDEQNICKITKESLAKTELKLHQLLLASPTVIYSANLSENLEITFISENVRTQFGYEADAVTNGRLFWASHIHPNDLQQVKTAVRNVLNKGKIIHEYRFLHSDGNYRWICDEMMIHLDNTGVPVEIMGFWLDITDHKKLEEQFLQAQKMETIGQLTGGIAHDFNNLLTVILGYSERLFNNPDNIDASRADIGEIHNAAEHAISLTRQLLTFSRKHMTHLQTVNINNIVENIEKMLKRLIGEDIKMSLNLGSDINAVEADEGQMEQVIMNLVVNARDAMANGGCLTIKTENAPVDKDFCEMTPVARQGNFVCLSVKDTGKGMDKETQKHLFEPFFTTKGPGKGTGLGLSVVYGIIKQHNGWVNVYSEVNHGTIFRIYLPSVPEKVKVEAKETLARQNYHGNGERILLVEDYEKIRDFSALVLRENGYVVFEAVDASQAEDIFEKENGNFDLVFSDVVLTDTSGVKLAEDFKRKKPGLHVLLTSGYSDHRSQWSEISNENMNFVKKPYTIMELLRAVREAINC